MQGVKKTIAKAYEEHCHACRENDCDPDSFEHYAQEWLEVQKREKRSEIVKARNAETSPALANHQHRSADDPLCQPDVSTLSTFGEVNEAE